MITSTMNVSRSNPLPHLGTLGILGSLNMSILKALHPGTVCSESKGHRNRFLKIINLFKKLKIAIAFNKVNRYSKVCTLLTIAASWTITIWSPLHDCAVHMVTTQCDNLDHRTQSHLPQFAFLPHIPSRKLNYENEAELQGRSSTRFGQSS